MHRGTVAAVLMSIILTGCRDSFEFSPNQRSDHDSPSGVYQKNLEILMNNAADDTVTIAFIGDSQRFYDETDQFVNRVNAIPDIDFVLIAGDISDFGLLQELEWINKRLKKLHAPYFVVVGNHDLVGNGQATFREFFGPLDYTFTYRGYKFVMHNTNGREYIGNNVPDITWLRNSFADTTASYVIGVSHVPPFDGDFNKELESCYRELLDQQSNLLVSLHGHQHRFSDGYPYGDGVRYIAGHPFDAHVFSKLTLVDSTLTVESVPF